MTTRFPAFRGVSLRAVGVLAALFTVFPTAASAQRSTTRGWSLGAHLQGTSLAVEGDGANSGGGLGVRFGYGFNRIVTGFVQLDGSSVDVPATNSPVQGQWAMGHAEIGARFHVANSLRRWVPWVEVAAGSRAVSVDGAQVNGQVEDVTFNGGAFSFGGGMATYFSRKLALDVSLKWTGGEFSEVNVGSVAVKNLDIDASSFRFGVGLVWWPK